LPPFPRGYFEAGHAFGVLLNLPLVWLALAAPMAWRDRAGAARSAVRGLAMAFLVLFGTSALTLGLHNSMNLRYEVEYAIPLVWLAVLGILGLERGTLVGQRVWRQAARLGSGLLLAFSVAFNLCARYSLYVETCQDLGNAALHQGQVDDAIRHYQGALAIEPDNAGVHNHLAGALWQQGKSREALEHYEQALRLKPDYARAHNNLGHALFQQGRVPEAIAHWEQALRLQPGNAVAHNNLGEALLQQGRVAEAVGHYETALRLTPDLADTHFNLGNALLRLERVPEAIGHYEQVLRLQPGDAGARNKLAWLLATCADASVRNGARAVELAQQADRLAGGGEPVIMDTLAAAYAEVGRFGDAVRTAQAAWELVQAAGQVEPARRIQQRLRLYQAGQPYREGLPLTAGSGSRTVPDP
jgi:tetratricopeptide (TPR) repeat protein